MEVSRSVGGRDEKKISRGERHNSDTESKARDKKRRKKEKKKEKKMMKKKKKTLRRSDSDGSSTGSSSGDKWTEKDTTSSKLPDPATGSSAASERDEWMSLPGLFPSVTKEKKQPQKREDTEKMMLDTLGQSKYELNPYWKSGGTGLPTEAKESSSGAGTVGDLGADWLRRALTRAKEQARDEGRSLEEVAAERWGSLAKLESMLAAAEAKSSNRDVRQMRGCAPQGNSFNSRGRGSYRDEARGREMEERRGNGRDDARAREVEDRRNDRRDGGRDERRGGRNREEDREERSGRDGGRGEDRTGMFQRPRNEDDDCRQESRFRKPEEDRPSEYRRRDSSYSSSRRPESSWRKKEFVDSKRESSTKSKSPDPDRHRERRSRSPRNDRKVHPDRIPEAPHDGLKKKPHEPSASVSASSKAPLQKSIAPSAVTNQDSSGDESMEVEEEAPEVSVVLTDKELNELGAKLVKAEILGNTALAEELKAKLNAARSVRTAMPARPVAAASRDTEVVILTRTDARGMVRPISGVAEQYGGGGRKKKGKVDTHNKEGQRVRYFPDDDDRSLKDMFESEKLSTVEDSNKMFSDMAGKVKPNDDMADLFEDRACRQPSAGAREARERSLAVGETKRSERSMDTCSLCMDSKHMLKHLVVAIGSKSYVSLPLQQSLTEGHCFIVPLNHSPCATQLDEDVWAEMKMFRTALTSMFLKLDQDVVYLETAMHLRKFPHAFIECVPMPSETGHMAPIYFKKAILECETEWSTNKKLVDTGKKDVRRSIPKGLPYFSVDFGNDGGFAHVIEDESVFPRNFAQEIVGGMLDLDHRLWRKPQRDNFESQRKKVLEFTKCWKPYDFTQAKGSDSDSS